jgi:hypothetical protein
MQRFLKIPSQQGLFDVSEVTDELFWNEAEAAALEALRDYAQHSGNSHRLQRQLFVDDALRGFGFVDLCRQRFDVVLMNPPFGAGSTRAKQDFERAYPRTKNDVYAAFVERGVEMLALGGRLGAITSRTGFFLPRFRKWREEIILQNAPPVVVADLGIGVMDAAVVEAAAYCLEKSAEGAR